MKIPTFNFNIYTILVWTNLYPDHFSSAEYSPGLIFTLDAFSERGFVPFFTIIVADIRGSKLRYFFVFPPIIFYLIFLCFQDIRPNSVTPLSFHSSSSPPQPQLHLTHIGSNENYCLLPFLTWLRQITSSPAPSHQNEKPDNFSWEVSQESHQLFTFIFFKRPKKASEKFE